MIVKKSLDLREAKIIVDTIIKKCETLPGPGVTVAAVGEGGDIIYLVRMDGTRLRTVRMATNKAYTAAVTQRETSLYAKQLEGRDIAWFGDPNETAVTGGLCVKLKDGTVIGGIGVSGRKLEDKPNDVELGLMGIAALGLDK